MTALQRQQRIEALIEAEGECSVEDLARRLRVSAMTIRRDLDALAAAGRAIRTHGGAVAAPRVSFEFAFLKRRELREAAKNRIGAAAARRVADGQTVMLDSGTTTLAVAHHLRGRNPLTVVTTSLPIASCLQHAGGVRVLLLGGYMRTDSADLTGALTESNLEQLRADLAIVGADAIDASGTVYHQSPETARLVSKMAAAANAVVVVADSSKLDKSALARSGSLRRWKTLVTDAGIPAALAAGLKRAAIRVIVAREA